MLGPKVRVMATKGMAIGAMVMIMVMVMDRPVVRPMLWMPMSRVSNLYPSRGSTKVIWSLCPLG